MADRPYYYDAKRLQAEQSALPSQEYMPAHQYSPEYQQDIAVLQRVRDGMDRQTEEMTEEYGPNGPFPGTKAYDDLNGAPEKKGAIFTLKTFESRPVNALDFVGPLRTPASVISNATYTVPLGYVAIVKTIYYKPQLLATPQAVTLFGVPTGVWDMTVLVNNNAVPNYSFIDITNGMPCGIELECFILMNAGDTISVQINSGVATLNPPQGQPGGVSFYGTLLLASGKSLPLEAGNCPIPTHESDETCDGSPESGGLPIATQAPAPSVPQYRDITLWLDPYRGPKPPNIGVVQYMQNLADHRAYVEKAIAEWKASHPGLNPNLAWRQ